MGEVKRPMLAWQSFLVFAHVMTAGAILTEFLESRMVGLLVLTVAALQGATTFYNRGGEHGGR